MQISAGIRTDKTRDRLFFEAHREEITIHKAENKAFDELSVKRGSRGEGPECGIRQTHGGEKTRPSLNTRKTGMV